MAERWANPQFRRRLLGAAAIVAVAVVALVLYYHNRISTDDAQDPSLSLPRQLAACRQIVQASGGELVALFWDIESGRKHLSERGTGADGDALGERVHGHHDDHERHAPGALVP